MIRNFRCKATEKLFDDEFIPRFQAFHRAARKKLEMLHAAETLEDLALVPGNRLESLRGDREGQHSIRINRRWRLCFEWRSTGACAVEIVDYH